ncbi:MAG: hypothetical protein FJX64_10060 [Alphaproteobacteria bacterium]|nr:hypothetical protein [Alphaproteobacteria bacterium]
MFHQGALIPGKHPRLEGGGDTGRFLKIGSVAEANSAKADIERVVRAWRDAEEAQPAKRRAAKKPTASRTAGAKKAAEKKKPVAKKEPAAKRRKK